MGDADNIPDPKTGLTPKEKALVTKNWALARKDPLQTGIALFQTCVYLIYFFNKKMRFIS